MLLDIDPTSLAGSSISELLLVVEDLLGSQTGRTKGDTIGEGPRQKNANAGQPKSDLNAGNSLAASLGLTEKVLVTEIVRLVRLGGVDELHEAALAISELMNTNTGNELANIDPDGRGVWLGYGDVLAEAARRRDPAALGPVLSAGKGKARVIVSAVKKAQDQGRPVSRKQMRELLDIDGGALTRLLIALEDADVIHRTKTKGEKEVWLKPGPMLEEAERQCRPAQVERKIEQSVLQTRYAENVPSVNASLTPIAAMT